MVQGLFVELPNLLDRDFRETITRVYGSYKWGARSEVVRKLIADWVKQNEGVKHE